MTPVSPVMLLAVEFVIYVLYAAVSLLILALAAAVIWDVRIDSSLLAFGGSWLLTVASTLSIGLMVGGVAKDAK